MKVLKFGGSSLATPERVRRAADIVLAAAREQRVVVVVSAFQGVTDQLLAAARAAERGEALTHTLLNALARRHRAAARRLAAPRARAEVVRRVDAQLGELRDALAGIRLLRHAPPRALDLVASFGERLSAAIVAAHLRSRHPAEAVDTRGLVITDDQFTRASVLQAPTAAALRRRLGGRAHRGTRTPIAVVTGFIGATEDGRTTTIGRNGSDYTAALVGAALGAAAIEIWTDVDGILSADPAVVPAAFVVPSLTYEEAMELSYFGAKVLHSATLAPAVARRIPVWIRNTFAPRSPGTCVAAESTAWQPVAKGVTCIDDMALLTLRGLEMVGVPGTAERLFGALARQEVNVILISQASSEHTICFAIATDGVARARRAIHHEFRFEFQNRLVVLDETLRQAIVAIVGEGMKGTPGVAGKVFQSLGDHGVNVTAIAQGASERNISFVVPSTARVRALRVVHEAFFEPTVKLRLVVIGKGTIGSALLDLLARQRADLLARGYDVRVCGIADRRRVALAPDGLDLLHWRATLARARQRLAPPQLARAIAALQWTNAAVVDCTASTAVVDAYPDFVRANLHIITPNKQANVLPWPRYQALMALLRERRKRFLYEANVGAGLPIISTLQDLIASGDTVERIEGVFSGTLSYLFNTFDGTTPFSVLVRQAHALGLTEPDPRDDLSGGDVARKLLILARELGLALELDDVAVENLVPPALRRGRFGPALFGRLARVDAALARRVAATRRTGAVLRYAAVLARGSARAGLREFPADHPFAATRHTDNVIAFTTRRYGATPLVVQGPGAGADVTAMGVFSDLLKLLHSLPR